MSVGSTLKYTWGQCTEYVAEKLTWIPAGLGNAGDWLGNAKRKGMPTSSTPVVGSAVVYAPGNEGAAHPYSSVGHVAVVTKINGDGTFGVSEMNVKGVNVVSTRTSSMRDVLGFILPPDGSAGSPPPAPPAPGGDGKAPTVAQIHSWDNPVNILTDIGSGLGGLLVRGGLVIVGVVILLIGIKVLFDGGAPTIKNVLPAPVRGAGKDAAVAG